MTVRATGVPPGGRRTRTVEGAVCSAASDTERGEEGRRERPLAGAPHAGRRRPAEAAASEQVGATPALNRADQDEEAAFNWGFGRERRAKTRRDRKAREPFR